MISLSSHSRVDTIPFSLPPLCEIFIHGLAADLRLVSWRERYAGCSDLGRFVPQQSLDVGMQVSFPENSVTHLKRYDNSLISSNVFSFQTLEQLELTCDRSNGGYLGRRMDFTTGKCNKNRFPPLYDVGL